MRTLVIGEVGGKKEGELRHGIQGAAAAGPKLTTHNNKQTLNAMTTNKNCFITSSVKTPPPPFLHLLHRNLKNTFDKTRTQRSRRSTVLRSSSSSSCFGVALLRNPVLCYCSASISDMDGTASTALYPLHRCKTLHLVRHAQGIHNVEGEKDHSAYMSPALFDAHLTPLGWEQVDNLHKHVTSCGLDKKIELVVVSPLLRTMQTAVGVFGSEGYVDGTDGAPLMVENSGNSTRSAISSLNAPPFIAVELCREHLGVHPCDKRRSVREYQTIFPAIDFSLIENDEDILWEADVREKNEHVAARGLKFIDWLWTREEKEIAVVTHSGFLYHAMAAFGKDCNPSVKEEISKHFSNCELRSVVIVDRKSIGSDPSTTNFSGKMPTGLDLPSGAAYEKHPENGVPNPSA